MLQSAPSAAVPTSQPEPKGQRRSQTLPAALSFVNQELLLFYRYVQNARRARCFITSAAGD